MKKILYGIIIVCLLHSTIYGAYENRWWGAKAIGMGGSFAAVADDYTAPNWNPAGLGDLYLAGIYFMYARPFWGLDEKFDLSNYYLSVFLPYYGIGKFAVSYTHFAVTDLYFENSYMLSYAVNVSDYWKKLFFNLRTGVNLKLYHRGYNLDERTKNDSLFANGTSVTVLSSDFGILISPFVKGSKNYWSIGAVIFDINSPDVGIANLDKIPRKYTIGFAYYIILPKLLRKTVITPSVQIYSSEYKDNIFMGFNAEFYKNIISVRAGYNGSGFSSGIGVNYKIKDIVVNFDYTYSLTTSINTVGASSHLFALSIKFPKLSLKINSPVPSGKPGKSSISKIEKN